MALFLLVLGVLIIFHEFGHFIFAKWFGVRVSNFAVGFGPTIAKWTRGETTYRLNLLPLGGYCQMVGEDQADDGSADPGNFQHHPLWQRFIIIVAGPVFNLMLAVGIAAGIAWAIGVPVAQTNIVESVAPDSPAARAGLQPGDQIETIDGQAFTSGQELVNYIHARPDQTLVVGIKRGDQVITQSIHTEKQAIGGGKYYGALGFAPKQEMRRESLLGAIGYGFTRTGTFIWLNLVGLVTVVAQHDISVLSGPVGIYRVFTQQSQFGFVAGIQFVGEISALLGFFNLLPVPALDGGRLVFLFVELVRGRPVDPEKEGLVHLTGFALLMVLVLFVTYHDIAMWVKGGL
ncbi:MAG: site-2 protease family protein [Candidatus Eremiobacteraeota bacterium]|nr:site-2 protease family protein [Candidatus Eremiobacteraeota bacterium]MBV8221855.1 site-2 protease family protein [Candidatus Eremiobacteraeota bacterium]